MKYIIKTSESPEINSAQTIVEEKKCKVNEFDLCVGAPNTITNRQHSLLDADKAAITLKINIDKKLRNKKY